MILDFINSSALVERAKYLFDFSSGKTTLTLR
jgi:hypothetical protein